MEADIDRLGKADRKRVSERWNRSFRDHKRGAECLSSTLVNSISKTGRVTGSSSIRTPKPSADRWRSHRFLPGSRGGPPTCRVVGL